MSSSAPKRRVSYFIPPPAGPLPRLELPPEGVHRNGATGPLLIPSKAAEGGGLYTPTTPTFTRERQPRHRLGVASLALDSATQLLGRPAPGGILYTGGRDGQVLAWDLGLPYRQRSRTYGLNSEGVNRRWEMLTGWGDDVYEDEDEEEDAPLAGDILGDVPVKRKRRGSMPDDPIPYEEQWELELEDNPRIQPAEYRQCVQMHSDWVNDMLLANYNQTVVSASSDGTVKAWSPHDTVASEPSIIGTHEDYVRCLTLCRTQGWVASGSFDRTIKLWDLSRSSSDSKSESDPLLTMNPPDGSGPKSSVYALAADPFGHCIASGSPERVVRLWDPRSGKRTAKLVGHTDNIRCILVSDDARYLLTGSSDASIKLWSLASQRCLHTFTHHTESVWSLHSAHPSLEVFYSGDRAGLLCRTDVEGATDVSGGECVLLAREPGEAHLAASEGITRIAAADDHLVWTATSSSSIRRWAVPPRRAVRAWAHTTSPGADSPPMPQTPPRNGSVAHRRSFVPSIVGSTVDAASVGGRAGLPYASLVRLVSANDPFAPAYPRARGDADVATLYSAASVMSVPRQTRTPLSPGFTLPAGPFSGVGDPEAEDDGRAAWEEREVAADAAPLCAGPLDVLVGEVGLVRSVMLNDRLHALTVDTHGVVAILDVVRGAYKGMFTREDVIAATRGPAGSSASSAAGSDGSDRDRDRSPREALETVRERIEGEAVVQTWCTLDTKTGVLAVHMGERCFEAEIYADEAGYPNERFNDEQRLNIGRWVLRNLFAEFIREEQRTQRKVQEHFGQPPSPGAVAPPPASGLLRTSAPNYIDFNVARTSLIRSASSTSLAASNQPLQTPSIVLASPALIPAVPLLPPMGAARSSPLVTPMIQLLPPSNGNQGPGLSPIPQSPPGLGEDGGTTPMPHPRRAMTASEDGVRAGAKDDYFSMRTRQTSAGAGNPSSPDEPPSASASAPATTPGAGLMGKFKSWRGTSKRTPSELGPLPTPGGTFITTSPSEDSTTRPSAIQLALHVLLSNPLTPPSTTDAPPLSLPPSTQITITEEAHPGWRTLYQGTLMHVAADMRALEEAMPIWLLEFLLVNKSPSIGVLKVGFVLVPYPAKNGDQLPELLNASQSKLTASRSLRVRKLLNHVQDKLEKMSQTPPHSPHNALPTGQTPRHTPKSTPRSSWGSHHGAKPKAEDLYEILCHDAVLPLDMTLAAVRQFVWRSSDELELHYRRKSPVLPVPPMPQRHS